MLGVFLIALLVLAAVAATSAARRRRRRGAAGEFVRQPKDVERDVYEKLYGSRSSEGRIGEPAPGEKGSQAAIHSNGVMPDRPMGEQTRAHDRTAASRMLAR